jgi:hypothetical protein
MPIDKLVGRYNPSTGKVEWSHNEDRVPENISPAIHGPVDFVAVGLPGTPRITSRNQYKALLKQHNMVVVGNDKSCAPPLPPHER